MFFGIVTMWMTVDEVSMPVWMRVASRVKWRDCFRDPAHQTGEIEYTKKYQHQAHRQFHRKPNSWRDNQAEQNDGRADQQNRDGVAEAPEAPNECRMPDAALAAYDGRNGNNVVGIGGVAHPDEKTKRYYGK